MKLNSCPREHEIVAAVREGRWPHGCDAAILAHVATCRHCGEVLLMAESLQQMRSETVRRAELPPAGVLWWRAQVRRRNSAIERVSAPIAVVGKVGLAATLLAALGLAGWQGSSAYNSLFRISEFFNFRWDALWALSVGPNSTAMWLLAGVGTIALCGALLYLAMERE